MIIDLCISIIFGLFGPNKMAQVNSNQKIWPPISNPDLIGSSQDTREIREVRQEPGRGRGRWRPAVGGQRGPSWDDQLSHTRIPKSWI